MATLMPPRADLPLEKVAGLGYVEYQPGKRALMSPEVGDMVSGIGFFIPGMSGTALINLRPVITGGRIYYLNGGSTWGDGRVPSLMYYVGTDGSTDVSGLSGRPFALQTFDGHSCYRLAISPDGKQIYMVGLNPGEGGGAAPVVLRRATDGEGPAVVFAGKTRNDRRRFDVGSSNETFNNPADVGCDSAGRVYVADSFNNRIQVLSPEGKWLKTIPVGGPRCLAVHRMTGAIYVLHRGEVQGRSIPRLTKLASFDHPAEEFHVNNFLCSGSRPAYGISVEVPGFFELDSWSTKPRQLS